MTIDKLLEMSASELEKLKGEDLVKYFSPYLSITRPEMAKRASTPSPRQTTLQISPEEAAKKQKIKDILADLGFGEDELGKDFNL